MLRVFDGKLQHVKQTLSPGEGRRDRTCKILKSNFNLRLWVRTLQTCSTLLDAKITLNIQKQFMHLRKSVFFFFQNETFTFFKERDSECLKLKISSLEQEQPAFQNRFYQ